MVMPETVAVIGAGPCGLSMLKTLREDGFRVTCFERREQVGGVWAYTDDPSMTTALEHTVANISKFTCGMTDFPMPDKYPHYLSQADLQEYLESYATHFDLLRDLVFKAHVKKVVRSDDDSKWLVHLLVNGEGSIKEFDKVVFCHGYQTKASMPTFQGADMFQGSLSHAQQFRRPSDYAGKNVVVLGISSTASDIVTSLVPVTSKLYVSHRRGAIVVPKYRNGYPPDLMASWRRRQVALFLQRVIPVGVISWLAVKITSKMANQIAGELDPAWRLTPTPPVNVVPRAMNAEVLEYLKDKSLISLHGIKRFTGPRSIEFDDGSIINDVDAVICATGYEADFDVAPFLEKSRPPNYNGPELVRLWMNLFPPKYASSMAMLCYSALGKSNGFSFSDVTSMAVSNVWRGLHPLPSTDVMENKIDAHHEWVAGRWKLDHAADTSAVKQDEYQSFLHDAAGTGMENLGWGWKGWKFFFKDPKMSYLMNNGVETAHAFRYFETGKRKTWPGARDAIIHINDLVKGEFPLKDQAVAKLK